MLAFQVAAGDVVKEQGGRDGAAFEIALVEGILDGLLAGAKLVEGGVEVVLVEGAVVENFGDGVILGPAHGGQPRALMSGAGQDEEEREFGQAGLAESGGEAEGIGDLLENEEQAEYGAAGGDRVEVVEVAAEGALEGEDAGGVPMGEVGEGAFMNLAVIVSAQNAVPCKPKWTGICPVFPDRSQQSDLVRPLACPVYFLSNTFRTAFSFETMPIENLADGAAAPARTATGTDGSERSLPFGGSVSVSIASL